MRRLAVLWMLSLSFAAAEDAPDPPEEDEAPPERVHTVEERPYEAEWDDLKLQPEANLRFFHDRLRLLPRALLTAGYDSNPGQDIEGNGRYFAGIWTGSGVEWKPATEDRITGEVLFEGAVHKVDEKENYGGRVKADWLHLGPWWSQSVHAMVWRTDSPNVLQTGRQVLHHEWEGVYGLGFGGAEHEVSLTGTWARTDYILDSPNFDSEVRDEQRLQISAGASWMRAPRSQIDVGVDVQRILPDDPGPYQRGLVVRGHGGWAIPIGKRSGANVILGAARFRFDERFAGDPLGGEETATIPEWHLDLSWSWETDSKITAYIERSGLPGVDADIAERDAIGTTLRKRAFTAASGYLAAGYERIANHGAPDDGIPERRWGHTVEVGAELFLDHGWLLRASSHYNDSRARIDAGYARTITAIQATVIF